MKGTIRQRKNKDGTTSWLCQVELPRDPGMNKRRFSSVVATTERAAHSALHQLIHERDAVVDERRETTALTVGELIERWLETGGPPALSTRAVYAGYIKNQIRPYLWDTRLDKLRVSDMDRWYLTLRHSGLKPASIRKAHTIVRAALAQGVRWGWLSVNVAAMAKPPVVPKSVVRTPRPSQVRDMVHFVAEFDRDFATFIRLAGVTGARPGEMCALQWHDIEFASGDVHVRRRIMRSADGMFAEDLTKTGKVRRVPLDNSTLGWLRDHRSQCEHRASEAGGKLKPTSFGSLTTLMALRSGGRTVSVESLPAYETGRACRECRSTVFVIRRRRP